MERIKIIDFDGLKGLVSDIKNHLLYSDIESITVVLPRRMALELLYMMDGMVYFGKKYEVCAIDYDVMDYDCYYLLEITSSGDLILEPAEYFDECIDDNEFKLCISDITYIYEECNFRILRNTISSFATMIFGVDGRWQRP